MPEGVHEGVSYESISEEMSQGNLKEGEMSGRKRMPEWKSRTATARAAVR
jgi:hypothetical protein